MTPRQIGRYEILSELGRGGMAAVYLAYDPNFRRQVALKLLPEKALENPMMRKRFEREAQSIAAIEHPAIVPVYDFGEQTGQLYLVMRYMPGGSLETRLRKGALPPDTTTAIITRLAHALDAVHAQGIIHRDLKPGNILFDAYDNAYISDFGIVHLAEANTVLTGEGMVGTPAYMSPEQVEGETELDARSDLYSLGVIVYEMLTGRQPFRATTPIAAAMQRLSRPAPPAAMFQPGLPDGVEPMLQKALARKPEDRYLTAQALASALSAALAGALPAGVSAPDRTHPPSPASDDDAQTVASPTAVPEGSPLFDEVATIPETKPSPRQETEPGRTLENASTRVDESLLPNPASQPAGQSQPAPRLTLQPQPSPARPWLRWAIPLVVVMFLGGFALFLLPGFLAGQGGVSDLPTLDVPELSRVAPGTPTPDLPAWVVENQWQRVMGEDFSSNVNGWPVGEDSGGSYGFSDGAYAISVQEPGQLYWVTPQQQPPGGDVHLRVTAVFYEGSDENYFGVVCRLQDANNYYYLVITSQGRYTMGKLQNGSFRSFLPEGWAQSSAIQGSTANQIQATCAGDTLALYVNNELLRELDDTTFSTGQAGLLVSALADPGVEIRFDDFEIYAP